MPKAHRIAHVAVTNTDQDKAALDRHPLPACQQAVPLRLPVSTADLVFVEGYDGPQPG